MSPLEQQARKLRDKVYCCDISDAQWENVKEAWMRDIEWLEKQSPLRCEYPASRMNGFAA